MPSLAASAAVPPPPKRTIITARGSAGMAGGGSDSQLQPPPSGIVGQPQLPPLAPSTGNNPVVQLLISMEDATRREIVAAYEGVIGALGDCNVPPIDPGSPVIQAPAAKQHRRELSRSPTAAPGTSAWGQAASNGAAHTAAMTFAATTPEVVASVHLAELAQLAPGPCIRQVTSMAIAYANGTAAVLASTLACINLIVLVLSADGLGSLPLPQRVTADAHPTALEPARWCVFARAAAFRLAGWARRSDNAAAEMCKNAAGRLSAAIAVSARSTDADTPTWAPFRTQLLREATSLMRASLQGPAPASPASIVAFVELQGTLETLPEDSAAAGLSPTRVIDDLLKTLVQTLHAHAAPCSPGWRSMVQLLARTTLGRLLSSVGTGRKTADAGSLALRCLYFSRLAGDLASASCSCTEHGVPDPSRVAPCYRPRVAAVTLVAQLFVAMGQQRASAGEVVRVVDTDLALMGAYLQRAKSHGVAVDESILGHLTSSAGWSRRRAEARSLLPSA